MQFRSACFFLLILISISSLLSHLLRTFKVFEEYLQGVHLQFVRCSSSLSAHPNGHI